MKTVRAIISGRVQGVGFRYYVYRSARDLGISGFVRNLINGDVEVLASGEPEILNTFLEELRRGPRMAHVRDMKIATVDEYGSSDTFEIR